MLFKHTNAGNAIWFEHHYDSSLPAMQPNRQKQKEREGHRGGAQHSD
jgi:hypothetical protein